MDPLGAIGLGLCAAAVVAAAVPRVSVLVWPLAAGAGLIGLVAIRRAYGARRPLVMPAVATGVGAFVFLLAVGCPAALGPTYEASRDRVPPPSDVRVIPHNQFVNDVDVSDSGWVNARKASQQQGRVKIEIADVWLEPSSPKRGSPPSELCIQIRMQRNKTGQEIAAGAFAAPLTWDEKVKATLQDGTGTTYTQKTVAPGRARAAGPSSAATITVEFCHELLVFDAPASTGDGLRLEIPAAAWGGTGTLRFFIPAAMVRPAPIRSK